MLQASSQGSQTLLAQRYRILKKIGEGGFGTVYQAVDEHPTKQVTGRPPVGMVAIKQINLLGLSSQEQIEATDSYNREITLLSRLHHKHLPRLHHHFTDPDHWYIVMDYISGQTLEDMLKAAPEGRLPAWRVREIGLQLCDVLTYLHNQQPPIIFRDVKPANVLLTEEGDLYLIDFGIARRYKLGQQRDTMPLGSPGYAAPEQYGQGRTTTQTDIYGLGATLKTLLTGKEPLDIAMGDVPPQNCIPKAWQGLLEQMTEKQPFQRPSDMDSVSRSLAIYPVGWQTQTMRARKFIARTAIPRTLAFLRDDFLDRDSPALRAGVKFIAAISSLVVGTIFIGILHFLLGISGLLTLVIWGALLLFVLYNLLASLSNFLYVFFTLTYKLLSAIYRLLRLLYKLGWQRRYYVLVAGRYVLGGCTLLLQAGRHLWQSITKAARSPFAAKSAQAAQNAQRPIYTVPLPPSFKRAKKATPATPPLVYIPPQIPVYSPPKKTSRQPFWKKHNNWQYGRGMQTSSKMQMPMQRHTKR